MFPPRGQRGAATLWVILTLSLIVGLSGSAAPAAQAAPGDLDPTFAGFGGDGVINPPFIVSDMAVQPDGKVVVVGGTTVARHLPNGQPDLTFDGDGQAAVPGNFLARSVALQGDGRIVVGGGNSNTFQLARLTPAGAPDTSFDGDGWFVDEDTMLRELQSVLVQPDGKIVACGSAEVGGDNDFAVTRYTVGGLRDTSFGGGDGLVTIPFGEEDGCMDIAQQTDGNLVVVGTRFDEGLFDGEYEDFAVARLLPGGTLDPTFDGDGKLTTGFSGDEYAHAVAIQPDLKIVVLGGQSDGNTSYLARYLPTGAPDGTFGSGGKLTIPADRLTELALLPDGTLVLVGTHTSPDGDNKVAVRRLLNDGNPDTSFDGDGIAWLDFGGNDRGGAVAALPDSRILLAGRSSQSGNLLVRLWPDGTFDTNGKQTQAVFGSIFPPGSAVTYSVLTAQPDGKLVVAGEVRRPEDSRLGAFLTRFNSDGQLDTNFGLQGLRLISDGIRSGARAVAVQPDGKIVVAGYSDWGNGVWPADFMVARYHPNGSPDVGFGGPCCHIRFLNFAGGADVATALALAPDGKIVIAGWAWTGAVQVWGVARLNSDGSPDMSFDQDGKRFLHVGPSAHAVLVQPDGKILVGGKTSFDDFALVRLLEGSQYDPGFGDNGIAKTDMGGTDNIAALALAPNGMIYAGGYSWGDGQDDMALAQYTPSGQLAVCPAGQTCAHWPTGTRFINIGASDSAYALALRGDDQLLAAGCTDYHVSAAQVSTTDANAATLLFETSFAGSFNCAFSAAFTGPNNSRIVTAGPQYFGADGNIALARFETTAEGSPAMPPGYQLFMPLVSR